MKDEGIKSKYIKLKYSCNDCEFETNIWNDALKHIYTHIGHTIHANGRRLSTLTHPVDKTC